MAPVTAATGEIPEQYCRARPSDVKRLTRPGLGFGGFWTARRTLSGYEAMAMMRKGQVRNIGGRDIRTQAAFIAGLFQVAAWEVNSALSQMTRVPTPNVATEPAGVAGFWTMPRRLALFGRFRSQRPQPSIGAPVAKCRRLPVPVRRHRRIGPGAQRT